jgi:8-oxo-dGTP pyrophosphatase MutT (NUDIX family)
LDILPLLDELQTIARNGLNYAQNPYDHERYERLLALVSLYYGESISLPPQNVRERLAAEFGHITPKLGADAAIFDADGRILLQQRADDGKWCLPCGWVEPNETTDQCAVREAKEETGLDVRVIQLVDVFSRFPSSENGPHAMVAVVYLCEVIGGALQKSHEGLDVRYWHIDDVPVWHKNHQKYATAAFETYLRHLK